MEKFKCHKEVNAKPMNLGEYNELRGWNIPVDENPEKEGYLVEYIDSDDKNHPDFEHYISWSPKSAFESGYKKV